MAEIDRVLKFGGFLSILDFDTPYPYSNEYIHKKGVLSHKHNNSSIFLSTSFYTVVNKFSFSHKNFHFTKVIDERVSLFLLFKEKGIFSGC